MRSLSHVLTLHCLHEIYETKVSESGVRPEPKKPKSVMLHEPYFKIASKIDNQCKTSQINRHDEN